MLIFAAMSCKDPAIEDPSAGRMARRRQREKRPGLLARRWTASVVLVFVCACHRGEDSGGLGFPFSSPARSSDEPRPNRPPQIVHIRGSVAYAAPQSDVGRVYMEVVNPSDAPDELIGVRCPEATGARMFVPETSRTVQPAASLKLELSAQGPEPAGSDSRAEFTVPAAGRLLLTRGGLHIELSGLPQPLVEEQWIALVLDFERSGSIPVAVPILFER